MKFLIVNFDQLGDVVFSSYIADFLFRQHPEAQIDVLCSTYTHQVAKRYLGINQVFAANPPWRSYFGNPKGELIQYLQVIRQVRATYYNSVYCASPHWKDVFAARLVKAKNYIGFVKRSFIKSCLTHPCEFPDNQTSILAAMQRLVFADHPHAIVEKPTYRLQTKRNTPNKKLIVLHPFSGDTRKIWSIENWLELAKRLRPNYPIRWIGSPKDIVKLSTYENIVKEEIYGFQEIADIEATMQLLECATTVVGHDSGPLHLAGALGAKGVALYSAMTAKKYYPQGVGNFAMLVGNPVSEIHFDAVYHAVQTCIAS